MDYDDNLTAVVVQFCLESHWPQAPCLSSPPLPQILRAYRSLVPAAKRTTMKPVNANLASTPMQRDLQAAVVLRSSGYTQRKCAESNARRICIHCSH